MPLGLVDFQSGFAFEELFKRFPLCYQIFWVDLYYASLILELIYVVLGFKVGNFGNLNYLIRLRSFLNCYNLGYSKSKFSLFGKLIPETSAKVINLLKRGN
jgi:hypothetical protein